MNTDRDILDIADEAYFARTLDAVSQREMRDLALRVAAHVRASTNTDQEAADVRATLQAVPGETLLRAAGRMRADRDALAEDLKLFRTMLRDLARRILGGDVGPA